MPVAEVLDDLISLDELASNDDNASRRGALIAIRDHIAHRDLGAKVSEAAEVLAISQPTIRAWIKAGILRSVTGTRPVRIEILSLADVRRALEEVRVNICDQQLLAAVRRRLRDGASRVDADVGLADLRAKNVTAIGADLRAEMQALPTQRRGPSSTKSR